MSTKSRKSSIAAFLFMPQFGMSFQGLRDMAPIFVRTFALILAQTGLIPNNHPATRFSEEGINEYSFRRLLGEAWFTLRTTKATPHQWGVFTSIVLMICVTIVAIVSFVLNITFNLGAAVQAQIFTHPGSPYGSGSATDITTMQSKVAGATGIFDFRVSGANVSVDYALMVLDKALRQGAVGAGGAAQNAFGSLMLVYNTAVLMIAGIILFWLILSVVVDTAKTGQIGGGRHNMVWAPIRIIFALGLMIPLGSAGFSSGQFMVMKLAEWGSNLATRGWTEYISGVATDDSLLASYTPKNASEIIRGITQITTCQAANNFYTKEATVGPGGSANLNYDGYILSLADRSGGAKDGKVTVIYTKRSGGEYDGSNSCGKIVFESPSIPDASETPLPAGQFNLSDFRAVLVNVNRTMKAALAELLTDSEPENAYTGAYPGGSDNLIKRARELSCAYLRSAIPAPFPEGMNTIPQCLNVSRTACGSQFDPASNVRRPPDVTCINEMTDIVHGKMGDAFNRARTSYFLPYIGSSILQQQQSRGWAAMGIFFYQITQMNTAIKDMEAPKVTYTPGTYTSGELPGTYEHFMSNNLLGSLMGHNAEHDGKVIQMNILFTQWWKSASNVGGRGVNTSLPHEKKIIVNEDDEEPKKDKGSFISRKIESALKENIDTGALRKMAEETEKQPLVQLISVGNWLVGIAGTITIVLTVVGAVIGYWIGGMWSPLLDLIFLAAKALLVSGLILTVWLPIVPIIRVGMSILTWIVSVFEAVVMVPIAALAHLSTEGEGLAGPAKQVWYLWLGVLLRPILTVVGFVGAFLIFNAFVLYFNKMFFESLDLMNAADNDWFIGKILKWTAYFGIYMFIVYTVANTTFKLIDQIPNALAKWIGGSVDQSFDDKNDSAMLAGIAAIKSARMGGKTGPQEVKVVNPTGTTKGGP